MQFLFDELSCPNIPKNPYQKHDIPKVQPNAFSCGFVEASGGQFSWVFKSSLGNKDVALKILKRNECSDFQQELDILKHLGSHPNVMTLVAICDNLAEAGIATGICEDQGIVLPWHCGGSLRDFVKTHPEVITDNKCLRNILLGICRGVHAIHRQKVVHRDIACRNFLVSSEGRILLSDFGLSRRLDSNTGSLHEPSQNYQYLYYEGGGLLPFRAVAPESLSSLVFTMRSDIWSLGILAIDLASKCMSVPFGSIRTPFDLGIALTTNSSLALDQLPNDCPHILRYFVQRCCVMKSRDRPSVHELIEGLIEGLRVPDEQLRVNTPSHQLQSNSDEKDPRISDNIDSYSDVTYPETDDETEGFELPIDRDADAAIEQVHWRKT